MKKDYFEFFPEKYLVDPALCSVSLEANGLWLKLICIMYNNKERQGYLLINGVKPTMESISRVCNAREDEIKRAIRELQSANVFGKSPDGVLFSRRIVRDLQSNAPNVSSFNPIEYPPTISAVISESERRGMSFTEKMAGDFIDYWSALGWKTKVGIISNWTFKLKKCYEMNREIKAKEKATPLQRNEGRRLEP